MAGEAGTGIAIYAQTLLLNLVDAALDKLRLHSAEANFKVIKARRGGPGWRSCRYQGRSELTVFSNSVV